MIVAVSTDDLVDDRQIGWIKYKEGNALLTVKVVRASNDRPFLAHVTAYRQGTTVRTVEYEDRLNWNKLSKHMLQAFREQVGDDYFFKFRAHRVGK